MLPRESRIQRLKRRARRRTDLTAPEGLEERTLLSFSNLGFSLPDLTIRGEAGPRAAWGGTIVVSAYLQNIGASTTTEPMSQAGATDTQAAGSLYSAASAADAPDSTVQVLLSPTPRSLKGAISLGTISAPPLEQNSVEQLSSPFTLPSRPAGFAGTGGKFYVWFVANSTNEFPEANVNNNLSKPVPVQITGQPLPSLRVVGLAVPSRMQPGDTINPTIVVENFGTADTSAQGPVTVDLVESVTKSFTLGSQIIATYTIDDLPGVSGTPTKGNYRTFAKPDPLPAGECRELGRQGSHSIDEPQHLLLGRGDRSPGRDQPTEPTQELIPGHSRCWAAHQRLTAGQHRVQWNHRAVPHGPLRRVGRQRLAVVVSSGAARNRSLGFGPPCCQGRTPARVRLSRC